MQVIFQTENLEDAIHYFTKDYKKQLGKIINYEYFIDQQKNTIVFKLFINKSEA